MRRRERKERGEDWDTATVGRGDSGEEHIFLLPQVVYNPSGETVKSPEKPVVDSLMP